MATRVHVLTSCKSTAISEGRPRPDGKRRKALLCLGLATTDECDDGEEVSSGRRLQRESCALERVVVSNDHPKHLGVHAGVGVWAGTVGG